MMATSTEKSSTLITNISQQTFETAISRAKMGAGLPISLPKLATIFSQMYAKQKYKLRKSMFISKNGECN